MLKIKSLTLKNFLSVGNVTQSINFTQQDLVLVLGENIDLGGNDNRNGVGKSAIVNALSYALYGEALTKIRKDNLINATNAKNMFVTLTFEINGVNYKIERGRKPGVFRFSKGDTSGDVKINNEQDDKADEDESQGESRLTQAEIERTIGISHDMFKHILALNTYVEPFLSLRTSDQRIIIEQLLGITKLSEKADKLKEDNKLTKDDIKEEEFRISAATEANRRIEQNISGLEVKSTAWDKAKDTKITKLKSSIEKMLTVEIDEEIKLHKSKKEAHDLNTEYKSLAKELTGLEKDVADCEKTIVKLKKVVSNSTEKVCPTCNQGMDQATHKSVHDDYLLQYNEAQLKLDEKTTKRDEIKSLADSVLSLIPDLPNTFYDTIDDAYAHKTTLDTLGNSLSAELDSENPFIDQIDTLKKDGLQDIDFTKLNELVKLKDHQEFLLKLLTSKDSFIRKKIIDQNLTFLNHRLSYYIENIGLPHSVKFKSDLEVEISIYGKEFDFDNLSRGERTRLILSLSWAFRDVFENMNNKINLLFIDELVDNGIDTAGTESVLRILKNMSRTNGKNIFLISHRDEFIGRVTNVLKVIKEGGFTSIEKMTTSEV